MGNPRQRKKARSSAHKTIKHSRHAKGKLRKMKPIRGPKALQDAWDSKKTVRQNYAAMGLVGSLKRVDSGGSEIPLPMIVSTPEAGPSTPSTTQNTKTFQQQYGKIIRDADGNVTGVEILGEDAESENKGPDDSVAPEGVEHNGQRTEVIEALEKLAKSSTPVLRFSSSGEIALLKRLIAKHGHDFEAMAKDRRLNCWQRTAGELKRASKKAGLA